MKKITVRDVSNTHVSELIGDTFRVSHLVLAAPTYNGDIYPVMSNYLHDMKALNVQKKTVGIIENGTWAATAGKQMRAMLEDLKDVTILPEQITVKSAMKENQEQKLDAFADAVVASMK